MNLCIVNDEKITADNMKSNLQWQTYGIRHVYVAYDADSARKILTEHSVEIVLLDIEMPGENGLSLLRWIREQQMDTECIFLTCHASFPYAQEAISLGARDYILMPARNEEIGEAVARTAERIRLKREAVTFTEIGKSVWDQEAEKAEEKYGTQKTPAQTAEEIAGYIRRNLTDGELSVNSLAEKMHLNPTYMNRMFKKEKGISVGQFIINERMKMAGYLLKEGKVNAESAAWQAGYKNYAAFRLAFKKYFGCSPSQYREKCRNQ